MKIEPVEILSEAPNIPVLRIPGRKFPGSLVQGDSLSILVQEAQELLSFVQVTGNEEAITVARDHLEKLQDRLEHYEKVLCAHGIELPYVKRA
jgi:hypothetical protein